MKPKLELLSPAGSFDSLKAAVACGCDAVYIGGKDYSARNYTSNFELSDINDAVSYCHLRGVKLYLAVNTLIKEREMSDFLCFIENCFNYGVDAFIIQDLGAAFEIVRCLPDAILHASTQMTAHSLDDINFLADNGFKRVVVARELSLGQIQSICNGSNAEIECFIHGALCVCYSGQCLMSSNVGTRSANRGRCAQPCRLKYDFFNNDTFIERGHLLSTCDLSAISFLPELIKTGVSSLKIEGRMKNAEYVAGTTYIYRKYIDLFFSDAKNFNVDVNDVKTLTQLFNRGGFSKGAFFSNPSVKSMSIQKPKHWGVYLGIVCSVKDNIIYFETAESITAGDGIEIWSVGGDSYGSYVNKKYNKGDRVSIKIKEKVNVGCFVYKTFDKCIHDKLKKYAGESRRISISGKFTAEVGKPCELSLFYNDLSITAYGSVVLQAVNNPLSKEFVEKQLCKMGSTTFLLQDVDICIESDCFLNIADLNCLRRNACNLLALKIVKFFWN